MKIKKIIAYVFIALMLVSSISIYIEPLNAQTTKKDKDDTEAMIKDTDGNYVSIFQAGVSINRSNIESNKVVKAVMKCVRWIVMVFIKVVGTLFAMLGVTDGTSIYFPQVNHIVYNILPFFDPNFISPSMAQTNPNDWYYLHGVLTPPSNRDYTVIEIMSDIIAPLYRTSITLVVSLFSVVALVIGIKLAVSVSAETKAQYKTAIKTWIVGIALVYTGHYMMSIIFNINEQIVQALYNASVNNDLKILIPVENELTEKEIEKAEEMATALLEDKDDIKVKYSKDNEDGYSFWTDPEIKEAAINEIMVKLTYQLTVETGFEGIFSSYMVRSKQGKMVATLIVAVLAGATLSLVILYLKRLFYCVILGILYPFVVAVDTFKKVIGGRGGLYEKWFGQFAITVLMQSIQAVVLTFATLALMQMYQLGGGIQTGAEIKAAFGKHAGVVQNELGSQIEYEVDTSMIQDDKQYLNLIGSGWGDTTDMTSQLNMGGFIALLEMIIIIAIIKLDDFVKKFFGLNSVAGTTKEASGEMLKGTAFAAAAARSLKDNFTGTVSGAKNVVRYNKGIKQQDDKINRIKADSGDNSPTKPDTKAPLDIPSTPKAGETTVAKPSSESSASTITSAQVSPAGTSSYASAAGTSTSIPGARTTSGTTAGSGTPEAARNFASAAFKGSGYANNELNIVNDRLQKIATLLENTRSKPQGAETSPEEKVQTPGSTTPAATPASTPKSTKKFNSDLDKAQDKLDELKTKRKDEVAKTGSKAAALAVTVPLAIAGTAIGSGAESEKLGATIIMAGDKIAESVGKMAVKTAYVPKEAIDASTKLITNKKEKARKLGAEKGNVSDIDD